MNSENENIFDKYPGLAQAKDYVDGVTSGKIEVCQEVKLSVKRFREMVNEPPKGFTFSPYFGERVIEFISHLPHIEGEWDTPTIILQPWQCWVIHAIFSFVDDDGYRMVKRAIIEVPRKNGKSALAAGIALYCMFAEAVGGAGAKVYSAATTRDQARIVHDAARGMMNKLKTLRDLKRIHVSKSHNTAGYITCQENDSVFKPLSSDASTLDGLNVSCAVIDEASQHKDKGQLYGKLNTATGARKQSLILQITTAGTNQYEAYYSRRVGLKQVLDGEYEDDSLFGVIYTLDKEDNWKHKKSWIKANPNYDISVDTKQIEKMANEAKNNNFAAQEFQNLQLNLWLDAAQGWMEMDAYDKAKAPTCYDWDDMALNGLPCWVGVDLSTRRDLTAVAYLWQLPDGKFFHKVKYFTPHEAIHLEGNAHYKQWEKQKYLRIFPGAMTNIQEIQDIIIEDGKKYNIQAVGYDPVQAAQMAKNLKMHLSCAVVEYKHIVVNFSQPMKLMDAHIHDGSLLHDGNPITRYCFSNVIVAEDRKREIWPRKEKPQDKIDGAVALIMAAGLSPIHEEKVEGENELYFL